MEGKRKWGPTCFAFWKIFWLSERLISVLCLELYSGGWCACFFFLSCWGNHTTCISTKVRLNVKPPKPLALSSPLHTSLKTLTVVLTWPDSLTCLEQNQPLTPLQVKKLWLASKANLLEQGYSQHLSSFNRCFVIDHFCVFLLFIGVGNKNGKSQTLFMFGDTE